QAVECAGLALVGMLFPEFKEAAAWRETGFRWLSDHMARDVYDDGTHWEVTPGYHGWVAERFTVAWRLAQLNGVDTPEGFTAKLHGMYRFDLRVVTPTGHGPMNGDCGRYSLRSRMAVGALLFDDPELRFAAAGDALPLNAFWLFGEDAFARYEAMPAREPAFAAVITPDSGYAIMRTGWDSDAAYFFFDLVPYGGGHSHPDQLSFELQKGGAILLGDSGRANYNHPLHGGYFRTPEAHNVCSVDGRFAAPDVSPERLEWTEREDWLTARGRVPITLESGDEVTWERGILWIRPDTWVIRDLFRGGGVHTVERWFNHAPPYPGNVPEEDARQKLGIPMDPGECIAVVDGERRLEPGWFGISASTRYDTESTVVTSRVEFPATLRCVVRARAGGAAPAARDVSPTSLEIALPDSGGAWRWSWPDGAGTSRVERRAHTE
ncbi:MAG: alginate lyase family protein, partial [Candidatus Hydrogenedentes bacterium]|nr:alginate lyase family protein [Candidatus Hydrogenedentota bacterium]